MWRGWETSPARWVLCFPKCPSIFGLYYKASKTIHLSPSTQVLTSKNPVSFIRKHPPMLEKISLLLWGCCCKVRLLPLVSTGELCREFATELFILKNPLWACQVFYNFRLIIKYGIRIGIPARTALSLPPNILSDDFNKDFVKNFIRYGGTTNNRDFIFRERVGWRVTYDFQTDFRGIRRKIVPFNRLTTKRVNIPHIIESSFRSTMGPVVIQSEVGTTRYFPGVRSSAFSNVISGICGSVGTSSVISTGSLMTFIIGFCISLHAIKTIHNESKSTVF